MWIINSIFGAIVDAALWPFRGMPPMMGLSVFSLASGVGMLYVFKWTSDQKGLEDVKRKIHAGIFEIRLFNDDMRAILAAQRDIFRFNLSYLRLALKPLLWMIVPFVVTVAQLQLSYGYEGLAVGEPVIVKVTMANGGGSDESRFAGERPRILRVPDGLRLETPRLWIPSHSEAAWRLVAVEPGSYELPITIRNGSGDIDYTKSVDVISGVGRRSLIRSSRLLDQILYPGEPGLPPESGIQSIEVLYPEREVNFLGWRTHWLVAFVIISIALAFALRKPLGVTF